MIRHHSALRLLVLQRRPFARSYGAPIRFRSHLQKSFQTCTGLQLLNPPNSANRVEDAVSEWEEFYTRARAIHNKVDFSKDSHSTVEGTIEKVESYGFPKDGDPTLDAACEALNNALQDACKAKVKCDTIKVKQAVDNLRNAYDEAAKSNTVMVRYIDVEPPSSPDSPLKKPNLKRILLARPWMKELIRDQALYSPEILVIGNPGSGEFLRLFLPLMHSSVCITNYNPGKSVALVGYLLFYLIARGERTILQSEHKDGRLGFVFDDDGVREVFAHNSRTYKDGRPCCLLVNADGKIVHPLDELDFCDRTIVVTSPNMKSKPRLENWKKQLKADEFIAPPPSCHEVVYLLYVKLFK